jgi:uncharacterized protein with NRDE domain
MTSENLILEIWETEEDKKLSNFDLKTKFKKLLQSKFQGRHYLNKNTGILISVSSDSIRQWVTKSRSREKIIIMKILDLLLENSKYEEVLIPDRKERVEIEHFKHFHQLVFINGKKYNAVMKVVKPVNQNHKFYYCSLEKMNT